MDIDTTDDGRLRLAQELLDSIIDHLHYDSVSLKRCALASKSLLPTCQRHLFSTYQVTESNMKKLVKLFTLPGSIDGDDEDATLRAVVANLLNTHTTDLILTDHPELVSGSTVRKAHLPEFKNVEKITFKGDNLGSAVTIPSFLEQTWMSPSSRIRSVEFDFSYLREKGILYSLYVLPATVDDVSFICAGVHGSYPALSATTIRREIGHGILRGRTYRGEHQFNGTMKLRLGPNFSHKELFSIMLELRELFKFRFERISYRLTWEANVLHLASLVDECKNTLQSLDIMVPSPSPYFGDRDVEVQSFDFSHHRALRSIRIWASGTLDLGWLCAAISSIPRPSSTAPRVPPLRIELHISLPRWMTHPEPSGLDVPGEVDKLTTPWIPVDAQLSALIGFDPDAPSTTSFTDGKTTGLLLDVTVPELTTGPGKGVAALMFPLLSSIKGLVRLV